MPVEQLVLDRLSVPSSTGSTAIIVKLEVPRSLFVHRSPGGYVHRVGDSKRVMTPDFLARLFQQRSQTRLIRFDEQPAANAHLGDLSEDLWERFRTVRSDDQPDITGPLDRQIIEASRFVLKNMRRGASKVVGRVDEPQFDMAAVFEALVNAVAHRDYTMHGAKIRLRLFADRLELFSPGALANSLTVDSLRYRQTARNETICSLLTRCPAPDEPWLTEGRAHYMEKRGEGVPIILDNSTALAGREPEYRVLDDAELMLTIHAPPADRADN